MREHCGIQLNHHTNNGEYKDKRPHSREKETRS